MPRFVQGRYVKPDSVGESFMACVPVALPPRPAIDWSDRGDAFL